jgi:hypothetical protein
METNPHPAVLKCDRCGLESTVKEAFVVKKKSALCFECEIKKQSRSHRLTLALLVLFGVITVWFNPSMAPYVLGLLAGFLLSYPMIFLHELMHALVARLVGFHVFIIHLGAGRVIYSTRLFGIRWYIHNGPISGSTSVAGLPMPYYQARQFLILSAGPGFHVVLIVLLNWLMAAGRGLFPVWVDTMLVMLFFFNVFVLLVNMIPRETTYAAGVTGTDGYQMLKILQGKDQPENFAGYYAAQALDATDRGDSAEARRWCDAGREQYPDDPVLLQTDCFLLLRGEDYALARGLLIHQLQIEPKMPEVRKYITYNNIAYADLMLEDPGLLPQADTLSAEAFNNMPWEPAIIGTRGETLIQLGQVADGIALLKLALARNVDPKNKALDAAYLARAKFRCGQLQDSKKYLGLAEKFDPNCVMLARVKIEMEEIIE